MGQGSSMRDVLFVFRLLGTSKDGREQILEAGNDVVEHFLMQILQETHEQRCPFLRREAV
jgi:hypothetical protein